MQDGAKPMLDVVLRTHAAGNYREGIMRVTDALGGKPELTARSLRSLVRALRAVEEAQAARVRLAVLDDRSDERARERMRKTLAVCPFETAFISLTEPGNAASMRAALEYAREHGEDLVYLVEDDYLHEETAVIEMVESYRIFAGNLGRAEVALFPVDQHDYYKRSIALTRVVPGSRRHWRLNDNTTSTFFLPASLLREQLDLFLKNPESEKTSPAGMTEEGSLNVVWREHALLFTPIPTLAYHTHRPEEMPPFSNWKKLWDGLGEKMADV